MLKNVNLVLFLFLFFNDALFASGNYTVSVDHITIAIKDLEASAKLLSKNGFVLKVPHHHKKGVQAGLITQAIRLKSGQYLQLVSVKKESGAMARWYTQRLKAGEGGTTVILEHSHPKELEELFNRSSLKVKLNKLAGYDWLSFKTESPYHPVAFIKYYKKPAISEELVAHTNGVQALKKVIVTQQGDPFVWAKMMTLAEARGTGLEFSELGYQGGGQFVKKIIMKTDSPRPSFSLGQTVFAFEKE